MKDGIIIINKPKGMTSHDVVDYVRKVLRIKKIGHSGTLDPLASGVLVLLVGKITKFFRRFLSYDKEYIATLSLGKVTDSGDALGKVIKETDVPEISQEKVEEIFKEFTGIIEQVPPMISALKYKGKRLYQLARKGIEIKLQPRKVIIKELKLLELKPKEIKFYVRCSTGTYIRKLATDIAQRLNCGGYVSEIERISVGPYSIKEAIDLKDVNESHILPPKDFI
ncbi:MAG: tRNA pseudouridine(55) synthase TruB [Candidatus Omnitrophica bacterium]|nr:tRNA pseudouridine(55) synthase TruB [Candidatus Omnitrophota bacterium]